MNTIKGFNQTHLANLITDAKCKIIPANVARIMNEIPEGRRQVMRFPGGTVANEYNVFQFGHVKAETKKSKWVNAKKNPIEPFIEASKTIGWQVIPVLNLVEPYNGKLESNLEMIQKFVDAKIPMEWVELGNELNIWTGVTGDYNRNKDAYNRAIDRYYDLSLEFHNEVKKYFPELKTAAVSAIFGNNGRDNAWANKFNAGPWDGIVIHHYESDTTGRNWLITLKEIVRQARTDNKALLLTEINYRLGPSTTHANYKANAGKSWTRDYQDEVWALCEQAGVDLMCYHNIAGDSEYSYLKM